MEHQVELEDAIVVILGENQFPELFTERFVAHVDILDVGVRADELFGLVKDGFAELAPDDSAALDHYLLGVDRVVFLDPKFDEAFFDEKTVGTSVEEVVGVTFLQIALVETQAKHFEPLEQLKFLFHRFISVVDTVKFEEHLSWGVGAEHIYERHEPLYAVDSHIGFHLNSDVIHASCQPFGQLLEELCCPREIHRDLLIEANLLVIFHEDFARDFAEAHHLCEDLGPLQKAHRLDKRLDMDRDCLLALAFSPMLERQLGHIALIEQSLQQHQLGFLFLFDLELPLFCSSFLLFFGAGKFLGGLLLLPGDLFH